MRILIVEDEHKIANSIKKGLEQEAYAIDVAYDGITGFDLASSEEFDTIILDIMLPGMNGLDICKQLRASEIHTPILLLTAKGQLEDKINGLNCGSDDYLVKPFAFTELLARIKALCRRPKQSLNSILSLDNLTLDSVNYSVKRDNKEISLSKREFSLLEYLMRHKNQILTKDQIINHVWPYDSDVLPNTVEVYIGYLRNKIDRPFKKNLSLIKTIRGFGYKIANV